MMTLASQVA